MPPETAATGRHRDESATQRGQQQQRASTDPLCVLPFSGGGRVRRTVAPVAGAARLSCFRVLAASAATLALAERRPAQLPFWTQADGAAKRSGAASRPGNEVFALLGGTGTGQCPVVGHRHHALIVLTGREGRRRPSWRTACSVGSMERGQTARSLAFGLWLGV